MNMLLTLKKFLKVNTIFLIPLLLLILGLLYTNNFNLNIKNLSQTYFYVIFIGLIFSGPLIKISFLAGLGTSTSTVRMSPVE